MSRPLEIEAVLRDAAPRVLASLVRRFGDFSSGEDAVQEAMVAAVEQWPRAGIPDNPVGWLVHVAGRRMIDETRSDSARRQRERLAVTREPPGPRVVPDEDDTLALIFLCCHPQLSAASAIALTLRAVGGLSTGEIAAAFLVPEATMGQRISRAKRSIKASRIEFGMPNRDEWSERLRAVLHVLYLIFNEGYVASGGSELARADLAAEAIRLTRLVRQMLPGDSEVAGLLALMLLTDARRPARADGEGRLIPLDEQDRSLWDRELIAEGRALLADAWRAGSAGEYLVQAQIAAVHDEARRYEDTDWLEIAALYARLARMSANPMIGLNRAIAVAMTEGPRAGLALLEPLEKSLGHHHRLYAVRAHLLEMAGDLEAAAHAYDEAARRTASVPEQQYLTTRAARLRPRSAASPANT